MQGFISGGVRAELLSPPVSPTLPHPVQTSEGGGVCGADGELERRRDLQEGTRIWLSGWSWRSACGGALPEPQFPQRAASQGWAPHRAEGGHLCSECWPCRRPWAFPCGPGGRAEQRRGCFCRALCAGPMAALPPALRLHGAAVDNVQSSASGTARLPAIYRRASLQPRRGLRITP